MEYFKYFPKTEYGNKSIINVLARTKLREFIKQNIYLYEPYVVRDGERPDILADKYYGHYKYAWLIFYANDIIDPIHDWPMNNYEMKKYLDFKYADPDQPDKTGFEISTQTVHEYRNRNNLIVDFESWYFDVFENVTSAMTPYDYTEGGSNEQLVRIISDEGTKKKILIHINAPYIGVGTVTSSRTFTLSAPISVDEDELVGSQVFLSVGEDGTWHKILHNTTTVLTVDTTTESLGEYTDYSIQNIIFAESDLELGSSMNPNQISSLGIDLGVKKIVTKFDYEMALNEAKRNIKLINKTYVNQIIQEFKSLLGA